MALIRVMAARSTAADAEAPRADRRMSAGLWALFHAQALLSSSPTSGNDAAIVEDDHQRLSRRH